MSVAYEGIGARIIEAIAVHAAASAEVRGFLGAADAAAARTVIVEGDGPAPTGAHLIIGLPRFRFRRTPGGAMTGTADVLVVCASPLTEGDTAAEDLRRALNWHGPILARLATLAWPRLAGIEDDPPVILDPSDGLGSWAVSEFRLSLDALP